MINTLDFLNKNMYRKYPLRDTCSMTFSDGTIFPSEIITSMQVSTIYGEHDIKITKVYITKGFISVTIATDDEVLGCFAGKVLTDFAVIPFTPANEINYVSGTMTVGRQEDLLTCKGSFHFDDSAQAKLEGSVVFCFTPPPVKKLVHENNEIAGRVTTSVSRNMTQTVPSPHVLLYSVTDTTSILSNNEFSGSIDTCPTPIIRKINTVLPDSEGNIDIYGILPIHMDIATGQLEIATPLELVDVCPEKNKISPPVNNSDSYYTDILNAGIAEWRTWDRFAP